MGEISSIGWTNSTINVWHGCTKVSDGCKHCYAEQSTPVRVKRARGLEVWGKDAVRDETLTWAQNLIRWNRAAHAAGQVHRVFGQSLSDTFEARSDLDPLRARFFAVVEQTPALTYQLLTKRPENILRMVPPSWLTCWPAHVWIGCTTESQATADERVLHLLRVPAAVRFLSVEPQVGPVDLTRICPSPHVQFDALRGYCGATPAEDTPAVTGIQWVICGGESGSKARPFDLSWARSLRDQCKAAGVPYFLKQLGARPHGHATPPPGAAGNPRGLVQGWHLRDSHGADESEWPEDLRGCRAFP